MTKDRSASTPSDTVGQRRSHVPILFPAAVVLALVAATGTLFFLEGWCPPKVSRCHGATRLGPVLSWVMVPGSGILAVPVVLAALKAALRNDRRPLAVAAMIVAALPMLALFAALAFLALMFLAAASTGP